MDNNGDKKIRVLDMLIQLEEIEKSIEAINHIKTEGDDLRIKEYQKVQEKIKTRLKELLPF